MAALQSMLKPAAKQAMDMGTPKNVIIRCSVQVMEALNHLP